MTNPFFNNSILTSLCDAYSILEDKKDKAIIAKMIRKYIASNTEFNLSVKDLSKLTDIKIQSNSKGISKCKSFALQYVGAINGYKNFYDWYDHKNYEEEFFENIYSYQEDYRFDWDLQAMRAYIRVSSEENIVKEAIESFDLYCTNIYIEKFTKIFEQLNEFGTNDKNQVLK